jgi:hypothetical protein
MNELHNLLIALALIQVFVYEVPKVTNHKLNFKPFNCSSCLSFHIGLILSIVFLNPIYITLYLFNQIYEKYV